MAKLLPALNLIYVMVCLIMRNRREGGTKKVGDIFVTCTIDWLIRVSCSGLSWFLSVLGVGIGVGSSLD